MTLKNYIVFDINFYVENLSDGYKLIHINYELNL